METKGHVTKKERDWSGAGVPGLLATTEAREAWRDSSTRPW